MQAGDMLAGAERAWRCQRIATIEDAAVREAVVLVPEGEAIVAWVPAGLTGHAREQAYAYLLFDLYTQVQGWSRTVGEVGRVLRCRERQCAA